MEAEIPDTYCTNCGQSIPKGSLFCPACGASCSSSAESGPPPHRFLLSMPEGLPNIDLTDYTAAERGEAISLINQLNTRQRAVWVQSGQPDILTWPGGEFASWLEGHAPGFGNQAREAAARGWAPSSQQAVARTNGFAVFGMTTSIFGATLHVLFGFSPTPLALALIAIGLYSSLIGWNKSNQPAGVGRKQSLAGMIIASTFLLTSFLWWVLWSVT